MSSPYYFPDYGVGAAGMPIATVGVAVGDVISLCCNLSSSTGAATGMSISLAFYDGATLISTETSNVVTLTTTPMFAYLNGITVPASTTNLCVYVTYTANADTVYCDYANLTLSPLAVYGEVAPGVDFTSILHTNKSLDNIADGPTTYARVKGTELSTGLVQQLNDGTHVRTITEARAAILSTADVNGNWVGPVSTSGATDDAGLGNSASFAKISSLPTTRSGYGITDAQATLPVTSGTKHVWASNSGGTVYETPIYGTEMNVAGYAQPDNSGTTTSTTFTQFGNDMVYANPGQEVSIVAIAPCSADFSTGTSAELCEACLQVSTDGGSTWTHGNIVYFYPVFSGAGANVAISPAVSLQNVTPTGDIHIRFMALVVVAGPTLEMRGITVLAWIQPQSNFSIKNATLAASIPATATASCTSTYPTTTCQASKSLTVSVTGGVTPYSYSNSIVTGGTGSGTITSGATAQTFTVTSASETATTGGATFTDECHSVVTDSTTPTAQVVTTDTCTITETFTLVYATISPSISVVAGSCSTGAATGTCTASGTFSVSATGGNGSYTYSNSVYSYASGFSTNPTIASGATASSGTYSGAATTTALPGTALAVTLQTSVNDTRSTGAETAQGTAKLTFKYTGS